MITSLNDKRKRGTLPWNTRVDFIFETYKDVCGEYITSIKKFERIEFYVISL